MAMQALQAVKENRVALMMEWDEMRPDDEKLENSKARMVKAARDGRKYDRRTPWWGSLAVAVQIQPHHVILRRVVRSDHVADRSRVEDTRNERVEVAPAEVGTPDVRGLPLAADREWIVATDGPLLRGQYQDLDVIEHDDAVDRVERHAAVGVVQPGIGREQASVFMAECRRRLEDVTIPQND